jgi:hypothetical protein
MLTWKRAVDRWNLTDDNDQIVGAVTHEVLATYPEMFDREREQRGWPEIPPPPPRPEPEWVPLSMAEIIAILDGGS